MITGAIWLAFCSLQVFAVGLASDPYSWTGEERRLLLIGHLSSFAAAILATIAVNA